MRQQWSPDSGENLATSRLIILLAIVFVAAIGLVTYLRLNAASD